MRTHPLPPLGLACVMQDLKVVVLQRTVVSRFGCFVFEFWVLRFRVWVLRFRDLGASFFEFWVLRFRVLRSSFSSASFSKLPWFRISRKISADLAYRISSDWSYFSQECNRLETVHPSCHTI